MRYIKFLTVALGAAVVVSCTKLEEEQRDSVNFQRASATGLLQGAYNSLNGLQTQDVVWALLEHSTDEALGPTRGPDWDDNGKWRVLHNHQWDADQEQVRNSFNSLLTAQFSATAVLEQNPTPSEAAQARFIRALSVFLVCDLYDQVPYREDLKDLKAVPVTLKGTEAADKVISELEAVLSTLPNIGNNTFVASKDAARVLLMKTYLNRGVYANRASPSFAAADMDKVIAYADAIMANPRYALNDNFYQNFAANNNTASKELIYSLENTPGVRSGNPHFQYFCTLHYNTKPSGWNGFTTLADFYDKFEATDTRRGADYPGVTDVTGLRVGLLVGQQYDQTGKELKDRKGNPLAFTREVALRETGNNLEVTGIRVVKYPPDFGQTASGEQPQFEYVIFRLADVMLMKAEALWRKNKADANALAILNTIRAKRGASALTAISDNGRTILDERGRELYWEGWRRNDQIRFGTFLDALTPGAGTTSTRPTKSGNERLIFPIPNQQLAVNPNLEQNPGY